MHFLSLVPGRCYSNHGLPTIHASRSRWMTAFQIFNWISCKKTELSQSPCSLQALACCRTSWHCMTPLAELTCTCMAHSFDVSNPRAVYGRTRSVAFKISDTHQKKKIVNICPAMSSGVHTVLQGPRGSPSPLKHVFFHSGTHPYHRPRW